MLDRWLGKFGRRPAARAAAMVPEAAELLDRCNFPEALQKAADILEVDPRCAAALRIAGVARCRMGDVPGGLESLGTALRLDSGNAGMHLDCGNALRAAGRKDDAELAYRRAISLAPDSTAPRKALGNLLLSNEREAEAGDEFDRALALDPNDRDAAGGAALAAYLTFDYRKSRDIYAPLYERGLLEPAERYYFGFSLQQTGQLDQAIAVFREALEIAPSGGPVAQMTERALGFCLLLAGKWEEGFQWHERRFDAVKLNTEGDVNGRWLTFLESALSDIPAWTEGECAGKRVLVWVEQGLGDAIMLMRLLPVLRDEYHAASVSLLCSPPEETFQTCFDGIRFFVASPTWKAQPGEYDLHCSIMSLPHLLKVTPERVPGRVPYVIASSTARDAWRERISALSGVKIGLVWAGNPIQTLDPLRSLALDQLKPLLAVTGVSFVSLQKDAAAREELHQREFRIADWMDDCGDFMETAALMDNLDLVISVDTAAAHLAGALGKPVWLLNRFESEWRWMRGREDSVWYPTMRIFSQTEPRQWAPVIDRIANELRALVNHAATIA